MELQSPESMGVWKNGYMWAARLNLLDTDSRGWRSLKFSLISQVAWMISPLSDRYIRTLTAILLDSF